MIYDKDNLIINFFERTYENLEKYKNLNKQDKEKYPYEVTMTINSLLGLLVFIKEKQKLELNEFQVDELIAKQKIETNQERYIFLKHLRNAVAHGNFKIKAQGKEIESIIFYDKRYRDKNKNFEIKLSLEDMEHLISELRMAIRESETKLVRGR